MRAYIVVVLGAVLGCGSSSVATPDADIVTYNCAADPRAETYTVGDEHMGVGGTIDVKLLSATPAPPARGDNSWVVEISSMASGVVGAPMAGLENNIVVTPWMPDHMHGTPILVEVTPVDGQPGQYTLDPVNLWMPGFWETTISVTQGTGSDAMTDRVVYKFCLSE